MGVISNIHKIKNIPKYGETTIPFKTIKNINKK